LRSDVVLLLEMDRREVVECGSRAMKETIRGGKMEG